MNICEPICCIYCVFLSPSFNGCPLSLSRFPDAGCPQELGLNGGDESIEPEAFKALDADGDGVVSKEDLKNKLQQLGFWIILAL